MQEHILNKLGAYSEGTEEEGNGFISMIKTGIFIFLAGVSTFRLFTYSFWYTTCVALLFSWVRAYWYVSFYTICMCCYLL